MNIFEKDSRVDQNNLKLFNWSQNKVTDDGVFSLMTSNVAKTIEEIHMAHCDLITDESIENILMDSKTIKYLIFHCCKKTTGNNDFCHMFFKWILVRFNNFVIK